MKHGPLSTGGLPIPNELAGQLPRRVRLSGSGIQMTVGGLLMLTLAVAFAYSFSIDAIPQAQHRSALRSGGGVAVGEVERIWPSGRSTKIKVKYKFIVNGREFTGESRLPPPQEDEVRHSNSLPIRFLPEDPAVNHPANWEWSVLLDWDLLAAPFIMVALAILLILPVHRERKVVVEGVPAEAVITKVGYTRGGFSVSYEFRTMEETTAAGSGWYKQRKEVGERIYILYLAQNPKRSQPFPSPNYRVIQ